MRNSSAIRGAFHRVATRQDVRRIVGDVDDAKLVAILSLQPSVSELEEAAMWSRGDGDVLGKAGHPLTGVAARLFDILAVEDEDEPLPPVR